MRCNPSRSLSCVLALLAATFAAADDARLGRDVVPFEQEVRLRLDPQESAYTGSVSVALRVVVAVSEFRFHADVASIDTLALSVAGEGVPVTHEHAAGQVTVRTEAPLEPGTYALDVGFSNPYDTKALSLYRMELDGDAYLFTQFEPDEARRAFPCWDEPSFKIPYRLIVETPEDNEVVSNTPVASARRADGWKTVAFRTTKPLPSYLVALAVGPLESIPIEGLRVPGRIYTVRGQSALAGTAARGTPSVLAELESWFGSPYPYAKLDLIAVPEYWAGAMEHPGAITFSDRILLLDPATAGPAQQRSLIQVNAHELAHQWFGNLVTMSWWDDLWLNESFADWMGDKVADRVAPQLAIDLNELQSVQRIMVQDARPSTPPIRRPVESTENLFENVGLAYNKGKAVLGMFERWIGPAKFREGVQSYLRENAWGNAVADDLWRALAAAGGKDLSASMATFIEQPGLPLVEIELAQEGGKLLLRQRRFLHAGVSAAPLLWKIPVVVRWHDGEALRETATLLEAAETTIDLGGEPRWLLPNADARGYYRWSLPAPQLLALVDSAAQQLSPRERVELVGNASALLDAGRMGGDDFMRLLRLLAHDPEPFVVSSVVGEVQKIKQAFVRAGLEEPFATWIRATLRPVLDRLGLERVDGESEAVTLVRPELLALLGDEGRDPEVRAFAARMAQRYLETPQAVDGSIVSTLLALSAQDGDRARFDLYRARFESAKDPTDRARYLRALGNFRDPQLREAALAYALEGPLRPNELFAIPLAMSDDVDGRQRRYAWLKRHYGDIAERIPPMFMGFTPFMASGCAAERLADAKAFFADPQRDVPGTVGNLAKVADQVGDCVQLRAREGQAVERYLTAAHN